MTHRPRQANPLAQPRSESRRHPMSVRDPRLALLVSLFGNAAVRDGSFAQPCRVRGGETLDELERQPAGRGRGSRPQASLSRKSRNDRSGVRRASGCRMTRRRSGPEGVALHRRDDLVRQRSPRTSHRTSRSLRTMSSFPGRPMQELSAELDGRSGGIADREDASADAVTALEHHDARACFGQTGRGGEAGDASADDDHIGLLAQGAHVRIRNLTPSLARGGTPKRLAGQETCAERRQRLAHSASGVEVESARRSAWSQDMAEVAGVDAVDGPLTVAARFAFREDTHSEHEGNRAPRASVDGAARRCQVA